MDVAAKLKERKQARMDRMKEVRGLSEVKRVRVTPKDEYRKVLKHPSTNQPFRESGSLEWPLDQFTKRRLREGAITIEDPQQRDTKAKSRSTHKADPTS